MADADNPLTGALDKLTRGRILTVFAVLNLLLPGIVGLLHVVRFTVRHNAQGQLVGGDYLAFYAAGSLVADGRGAELYDAAAQRGVQSVVAGTPLDRWQPFVNPPGLAIGLAPTVPWGYAASFQIACAVLAIAAFAGAIALWRSTPALGSRPVDGVTLVALLLGFNPMVWTMAGGQNAGLTFGLLCGVYAGIAGGRPVVTGICLGLLTYKPQFVPVIGLWLLWRREWTAVAVGAALGLLHFAVGAVVVGPAWPVEMLRATAWLVDLDPGTHVSLPPNLREWAPPLAGPLSFAAIVAVFGGLAALLRRAEEPSLQLALVLVATLLASPHLQYYDFGLVGVVVVLGLDTLARRGTSPPLGLRIAIAGVFVSYPVLWPLGGRFGVQPLLFVLLATAAWLASLTRR